MSTRRCVFNDYLRWVRRHLWYILRRLLCVHLDSSGQALEQSRPARVIARPTERGLSHLTISRNTIKPFDPFQWGGGGAKCCESHTTLSFSEISIIHAATDFTEMPFRYGPLQVLGHFSKVIPILESLIWRIILFSWRWDWVKTIMW